MQAAAVVGSTTLLAPAALYLGHLDMLLLHLTTRRRHHAAFTTTVAAVDIVAAAAPTYASTDLYANCCSITTSSFAFSNNFWKIKFLCVVVVEYKIISKIKNDKFIFWYKFIDATHIFMADQIYSIPPSPRYTGILDSTNTAATIRGCNQTIKYQQQCGAPLWKMFNSPREKFKCCYGFNRFLLFVELGKQSDGWRLRRTCWINAIDAASGWQCTKSVSMAE